MKFLKIGILFLTICISAVQSFSQGGRLRERLQNSSTSNKETPPPPDYSDMRSWASHPLIHDFGDSIPKPLRKEYSYDSTVDVFFIHPTTYIRKENGQMNGDINNESLNDRTDKRPILNQASAFNEYRLFAPRYRQANYSAYLNILGDSKPYFDTAYADVKKAFEYYLSHWNNGHPFFIASHSQGSQHAVRLIEELIEGTQLEKKLIVAYIIGMPPLSSDKLKTPVCNDSSQTGCYVAWNSFTEDFRQRFGFLDNVQLQTVNPLTWKTSENKGTTAMHKGAVVKDFNSVKEHALSAQIRGNKLVVSSDSESLEIPDRIENLHVLDINLFFVDIRNNLRTRVIAYKKKSSLL
jgi:hypothetical protein